LIGIIAPRSEAPAVEEFFELFKTPWEWYRPEQHYDVIVVAGDERPRISPKLLIVFSSSVTRVDEVCGIVADRRAGRSTVEWQDVTLPIYGSLLTFSEESRGEPSVRSHSGPAAISVTRDHQTVQRVGYDLFREVEFLLTEGQPVSEAHIPTLDIHIQMLRDWILLAGIPVLEIPPVPAGYQFSVCLTHDIDFVGIRNHKFDHTMWGFLYRATVGVAWNFVRRKTSLSRVLHSWRAALALPAVFLGWAKDFWEPFEWYLRVERGLPVTYFLIPFKGRGGDKVPGPHPGRRAAGYDLYRLGPALEKLRDAGCEIAVHGIDAWHSVEKGREELNRITAVNGGSSQGIRMHWLLRDADTFRVLEEAGYSYDSTVGYNETVGYRAGVTQVYRPLDTERLLELPMLIQDGALFYPGRLGLREDEARRRCTCITKHVAKSGGILTLLWHDRSHAPERFWGDFYAAMIDDLRLMGAWFPTAEQAVKWFRKRRQVRFERALSTVAPGRSIDSIVSGLVEPPLKVRLYEPRGSVPMKAEFREVHWDGRVPPMKSGGDTAAPETAVELIPTA
jgi:hypothetical protein